jgi:cytoplasmic iron level regulating protein YaaA (DUF328/UPF0246 family)
MIIILHTSKTMRSSAHDGITLHTPELLDKTADLATYLKTLSSKQLASIMKISPTLATKTHEVIADWNTTSTHQSPAIDSFIGDIYSGLRADTLSATDRDYADEHLRILSGLYGILRPYDGIVPYRLEMGYRLPDPKYKNLYEFWNDSIAKTLPAHELIINLAAVEYSKAITPFVDASRIITPKFLTVDQKTGEPTFVVVHAKIARGAFARWLIMSRINSADRLHEFADIGYRYDAMLSTPSEPVFVCQEFGGKGLSMRLQR